VVERNPAGETAAETGTSPMREIELCGYGLQPNVPTIVPAPVRRDWIEEETADRFATRCLPMMIANQAGWFVLNTVSVRVTWSGGDSRSDLVVDYGRSPPSNPPVVSYFGHGIVTWRIPILFRTPPRVQLLARGPANQPKPDVYPLEGIVETSWSIATFTMNWKVLTPSRVIPFDEGEPICMLVPICLDDLERVAPVSK
jgi:uncharacterized protein DUF6065